MTEPSIEVKKVVVDQVVVNDNNGTFADADDVINILTIVTNSDKINNYISENKKSAADYLVHAGLIKETNKNEYAVVDMKGCVSLQNQLSNYMENLISNVLDKNGK